MKKKALALSIGAVLSATALLGAVPVSMAIDAVANQSASYATISSETDGTTVNLLSGDAYTFASNYAINVSQPYCTQFCNGTTKTNPTPAHITWKDTGNANYYTVKLSRNADMSGAETYSCIQNYLDVEDLFMGTKYYYQIYAHRDDSVVKSKVFSFTTAHLPRTIRLDTTYLDANFRDIGGYYTEDGNHRVKQGLAYRGAEVKHYTQEAKEKLVYELGIKTELAVHNEETSYLSDFGFSQESGNYVYTAGPHYVEWYGIAFYGDQTQENLKKELLVFADPANFPVFFHCQLGRDRTGTLAFVLGALLGVGKEDLFLDYELSYLTQYGGYGWTGDNCAENKVYQFEAMYQFINDGTCVNYSKETLTNQYFDPTDTSLAERMETYLKGCLGITDAQIAAIRANMLEEV